MPDLKFINHLISVDPDEPQHLDAAVLWRIKLLKYEDQNGPPAAAIPGLVPDEDIRNINAVLSAYRPRESLWDKIWEEQQAWTKVYGDSQPWVEDVCEAYYSELWLLT
jgi:hypothetical protein